MIRANKLLPFPNCSMPYRLKISGGLGNQLFQYCVLMELVKHGKVLANVSDFAVHQIHEGFLLQKLLPRNLTYLQTKPCVSDRLIEMVSARGLALPFIHYDYRGRRVPVGSRGWYFGTFITDEFATRNIRLSLLSHIRESSIIFKKEKKSTLVHLRLGDFQSGRYRNLLGRLIETNYFRNALSASLSDKNVAVISDSMDFELIYKIIGCDFEYVDTKSLSSWDLLALMVNSVDFVGSNSTLSLWGALLRQSINKPSFLPKVWYFEDGWHFPKITDQRFMNLVGAE